MPPWCIVYYALYSALSHATMMYTLQSVMPPWCILCIILWSPSCYYAMINTLHSLLVPWCLLCIILCTPSCHHHECSACILLPWWMQSEHVYSALISYQEPASLQDKCRVCKLCLILCQNLWSLPPLRFQYSAQILEWFSIRKFEIEHLFVNWSKQHKCQLLSCRSQCGAFVKNIPSCIIPWYQVIIAKSGHFCFF